MSNKLSINITSATYFLPSSPKEVEAFRSIMNKKVRQSSRIKKEGINKYSFRFRRPGVSFGGSLELMLSVPHSGVRVAIDCDSWIGPNVKKIAEELNTLFGDYSYSKCVVFGIALRASLEKCYRPEDLVMVVRNVIFPNVGGEFAPLKIMTERVDVYAKVLVAGDSENNEGDTCGARLAVEFLSLDYRFGNAIDNLYRAFRNISFGHLEGLSNSLPEDVISKAALRGLKKTFTGNHSLQSIVSALIEDAESISWRKPYKYSWCNLLRSALHLKTAGFDTRR